MSHGAILAADMEDPTKKPIEVAFERAGGMAQLARLLGRTRAAANHWKGRVPAELCPDIELFTGVKCEDLRPDVKWHVLRRPRVVVPRQG